MNTTKLAMPLAIGMVLSALPMTTQSAMADSRQKNKNLWRNLAIGAGVIAGHGLINHNGTETLIGAAGAAYSANRYEQDRKSQSRANSRRYHRSWRNWSGNKYRAYSTYHPTGAYGTYPNIQNFTRNGHVYTRNLDTGEVYLSKW